MEFSCPTCDNDVEFRGDRNYAEGECPDCGTVTIYPGEIWESEEAERARDEARDARFE